MLTAEENDRLTRVGAGTPMGELMRRYWHPFLPESMLDEDPVQKVRLLGEDLVCYRDRSGTIGLVADKCAHRGMSLEYGFPDECGLRCSYHGWMYDRTGQCIDTPLESPHSTLKERVRIKAYPVQSVGGLLFTYMGPDPVPVLPRWDVLVWPNAIRQIGHTVIPCNWLQCQENAADPTHSFYLHGHLFRYVLERKGMLDRTVDPNHPSTAIIRNSIGYDHIEVAPEPYGMRKATVYKKTRGAAEDRTHWHSYLIFPYYVRPGGGGGVRHQLQIRVPMDDTHTYHIDYTIYVAPPEIELPAQPSVPHFEVPINDEQGRPILDYIVSQDMVGWWSQGPITDRSKETLAGTDFAIRRFREMLEEQLRIVEDGRDPMNVFRDEEAMGDIIHLKPRIDDASKLWFSRSYFDNLHKGFLEDTEVRFSPNADDVLELMKQLDKSVSASS